MKESGFIGDDEEEISSDDSNNYKVEFFSVHHIERDDSHRQSTVSDELFHEESLKKHSERLPAK